MSNWEIKANIWENSAINKALRTTLLHSKVWELPSVFNLMINPPYPSQERHASVAKECASFRAYFRLSPQKRVQIFFVKRNLPNEIIFRHFGSGYFEMPFAYELPGFILKRLGLEYYKIHAGMYPVQEDCHFIKVCL